MSGLSPCDTLGPVAHVTVQYERYPFLYRVRPEPDYDGPRPYRVQYDTLVVGYSAEVRDPVDGRLHALLTDDGKMTLFEGAVWDGASSIAIDTPSFMDASLCHDYLYEMIAQCLVPRHERKNADRTMRAIAKQHGMWWPRRIWTYWAVRKAGGPFTKFPSHM